MTRISNPGIIRGKELVPGEIKTGGQTLQFQYLWHERENQEELGLVWWNDLFFLVVFEGGVGDPSPGASTPPLPHSHPHAEGRGQGAECFVFFNKVRNPMDTQNKTALRKKK